jgi:8-oxo-dGTP pyrophosphatase MutT (NUDIX family)
MQIAEVRALLEAFECGPDGEGEKSRELILALLAWSPEPFSRHVYTPGHITCTGVVLDADGRILLVHHRRLDRWLLPGGHCEADDVTAAGVARREVLEETGAMLADVAPRLVGVDVHPIPPGRNEPLHLHHDLIFAFRAASARTECSEESRAVSWCGPDEFDRYDLPAPIRRAATRAARSDVQPDATH